MSISSIGKYNLERERLIFVNIKERNMDLFKIKRFIFLNRLIMIHELKKYHL